VHRGARLDDGRPADAGLYRRLADEEIGRLAPPGSAAGRFAEARAILDGLVLDPGFVDFLTLETYNHFA
jgi:hypothetical protein